MLSPQSHISSEYAVWWRKLTPQEKRSLINSGAFRAEDPMDNTPENSRSKLNGNHFDFQRNEEESFNRVQERLGSFKMPEGSGNHTVEQVMRNEEKESNDPRLEQLEIASIRLRSTLHFLLDGLDTSTDKSMRLHADVIRIVVGEGKPPSMTALAKRHKLSKAAVSLRCRKLLRVLGLEPSRFMRPEDEVNSMRVSSILRNSKIEKQGHSPQ